jgi:hypothetical protein
MADRSGLWPAVIGVAVVVVGVIIPIRKMRQFACLAERARRLEARARHLQGERAVTEAEAFVVEEQLRLMREHPELFDPQ